MIRTTYAHFHDLLIHPDPRRQRLAILGLLVIGGLGLGLLVGATGPAIALALVVTGLGGWLVLRSPLWGLVGIVAVSTLLPFATLPFKIGFTPSFLDLAVFATFGVWVVKYIVREETRLDLSPIGWLVLVFTVMTAFAFALGLRYSRPTSNNLRQFLEMVLSIALFFVVINTIRERSQLLFFARVLILGGAAAAFLAVLFYVWPRTATVWVLDRLARVGYPGGIGALRFVNDDTSGTMRAIGTSIDPNVLGGLLILTGLFTLPQLFTAQPLFRWRWLGLIVGLEILAIYFTMSRGSLLGFVAGGIALGVLRYRKLLVLGLAAGLIFLVLPFTQDYVQYLLIGFAGQDRSTQMRFGEYRDAFTLISRYPVFGVGFTGTPEIGLYIGVSSLYLLMTEEMGLVGLVIFLITITVFLLSLLGGLRRLRRLQASDSPDWQLEALLLGVLAAMLGLLVGGIFDHYMFNLTYPHMTSLLWILTGLGMATQRLLPAEQTAREPVLRAAPVHPAPSQAQRSGAVD